MCSPIYTLVYLLVLGASSYCVVCLDTTHRILESQNGSKAVSTNNFRQLMMMTNVMCLDYETHILNTQHNKKRHPAPWNTRTCRCDYTSNIRITKSNHSSFHQQFQTPDDDQCCVSRLRDSQSRYKTQQEDRKKLKDHVDGMGEN
jgi:hypothetical protein